MPNKTPGSYPVSPPGIPNRLASSSAVNSKTVAGTPSAANMPGMAPGTGGASSNAATDSHVAGTPSAASPAPGAGSASSTPVKR